MTTMINSFFTPYRMKLSLEISILIDICDPIYAFSEVTQWLIRKPDKYLRQLLKTYKEET